MSDLGRLAQMHQKLLDYERNRPDFAERLEREFPDNDLIRAFGGEGAALIIRSCDIQVRPKTCDHLWDHEALGGHCLRCGEEHHLDTTDEIQP